MDKHTNLFGHTPSDVLALANLKSWRGPKPERPADLPELRAWLVDKWGEDGLFNYATEHGVFGIKGVASTTYVQQERRGLERASLWWVAPQMCDLLNGVSQSIPLSTELNGELLLDAAHTCGFVWFENPLEGTDAHTGSAIRTDGMLWNPIRYPSIVPELQPYEDNDVPGIGMSWYQWDEQTHSVLPLGRSDWLLGSTIEDDTVVRIGLQEGHISEEWADSFLAAAIEDRKLLASFLALSTQKGLSTVKEQMPDRPARRRLERAKKPVSPVRVIYLRNQSVSETHVGDDREKRNYSHRWIVDAHWRNQAYGPNHSLRRPTLIAPHLKGPSDKPLVLKETVRVINR